MGPAEDEAVEEEPIQPISALTASVIARDKACVVTGQREFMDPESPR